MRGKQIFYFLSLLLSIGGFVKPSYCQTNDSGSNVAYVQLLQTLRQKDFFHLGKQLAEQKQKLSPVQRLYFQACLNNAFNQNKNAVNRIDSLLDRFAADLQDSVKTELYALRSDSYFKLFEYAKAAESDSVLLAQYRHAFDSSKIAEIENELIIYNGLKSIPRQQTSIARNTTILWKRNTLGIVEIPMVCRHSTYDAVFDTRANISTITQTYADKLGLHTLPVYYYEGSGITGIRFKTSLAVADSLYLGNILVRHAVFQVLPDSILYIAPVKFQINIIVGFPIIAQLKEVRFYKNGRMEIPVRATKKGLHNLALDELNPVVMLSTSSGDTLPFAFDFGASKTILFAAYFEKYKNEVVAKGAKRTSEYGGAGGTQKKEVLTLPFVDLYLGKTKARLDSIDVLSEKIYPEETFYGNIGQDFVNSFRVLVMNFQDMYIEGL